MHLTNYSLNKKADGFKHSTAVDGGDDGSKRTVSSVFASLAACPLYRHRRRHAFYVGIADGM